MARGSAGASTHGERAAAQRAKVEEVSRRLGAAVEALTSGEDWARAMAFAARFRSRSFANTLLIWSQHQHAYESGQVLSPEPTYVAGFKQWQQVGRCVDGGQRGYMILAPRTARFVAGDEGETAPRRRLGPGEQPDPGEQAASRMVGVKRAWVWDVSQTSGDPIPERPRPQLLEGQAPAGLWEGLAAQVAARGFSLHDVDDAAALGGANGMTDYRDRGVSVRGDMAPAARVKTLAHELAHVVMHEPTDEGRSPHRGIVEVEAESVAMMVGAAFGIDTAGYTVGYVGGWAASVAGKRPVEVVRETGERVRRVALDILTLLPDTGIGDGRPPGLTAPTTTPRAAEHAPTVHAASRSLSTVSMSLPTV